MIKSSPYIRCIKYIRFKLWHFSLDILCKNKKTCAGGGLMILGLFCSHTTWAPHSHRVEHELLCIPKYSRVKCEAIHPTAKVGPTLGDATGQ